MRIRNKKRAILLIALLVFALICAMPVLAIVTDANLTHVEDNVGFLTETERQNLEKKLEEVSKKHGCDVVFYTCDSVGGEKAEHYALDYYYDSNKYSQDGFIMLLTRDRDFAFAATRGKCENAMTDDAYDVLRDEIKPMLSDGDYYAAAVGFADYCDEFMTAYENGEPYEKPKNVGGRLAVAGAAAAGVGGLTGAIGTGSMKGKLKSVARKNYASDYVKRDSLNVMAANEMYLYSNVVRTPIPRNDERSGSGGGSHSFTTSSGHSGSGISGKF